MGRQVPDFETRLLTAGYSLPDPIGTSYQYVPARTCGHLLHVSGQIAKTGADVAYPVGRVGASVAVDAARAAAARCVLQALSWASASLDDPTQISGPANMTVYVAAETDEVDISVVADGAAEVIKAAFGKEWLSPRSVIGVRQLPRSAPVLVQITFALKQT